MARNRLPIFSVTKFGTGLNKIMSATKIADSDTPDCQNIEFKENGLPGKCSGTSAYGDAVDTAVLGLGSLYLPDTTRIHLRNSATKLYKEVDNVWTEITGKTFTTAKDVNYVQARGSIYIHNGTDSMGKYDGTTLSSPAQGVVAKYGIFYASRHVVAGNATYPSRLYFSSSVSGDDFTGVNGTASAGASSTLTDSSKAWTTNAYVGLVLTIVSGTGAGQYRTIASNTSTVLTVSAAWTTAPDTTSKYNIEGGDTLDVAKDDGQKITGLGKYEEKLIVFKDRSTYQLSFDEQGFPTVTLVSAAYGCVSHRTVESAENDLWFLSQEGVRTLGYVPNIPQVLRTTQISAKVRPIIDNINPLYYEKCAAIYHNNHFILAYPEGSATHNTALIAFNFLYGGWTYLNGRTAACFNTFIDSTGRENAYYGSSTSGQVYQMFTDNYSNAGAGIDSYWYSKQFDLGNPNLQKGIVFVDIQLRALTGTLGIDIIVDGQTTTLSTSLSSTFSGKDGLRIFLLREAMLREDAGATASTVSSDDVRRIYINKDARTVQVKVYNSNPDENFTLMGIWIGYQPRSPYIFDSSKVIY